MTPLQQQREIELAEKFAEAARKQLALDREKLAKLQGKAPLQPVTR